MLQNSQRGAESSATIGYGSDDQEDDDEEEESDRHGSNDSGSSAESGITMRIDKSQEGSVATTPSLGKIVSSTGTRSFFVTSLDDEDEDEAVLGGDAPASVCSSGDEEDTNAGGTEGT